MTAAESVDHCPPKSVFDSFRPKGLEFPQCPECQEGTRGVDAIVGMLSRIYPDPKTAEGRAGSRKFIRGFINNHRELASVFITGNEKPERYRGEVGYPINLADNDRIHRVVETFAARLGAALYYEHTKKIVPPGWTITVRWQTNVMLDSDEQLEALLRSLGLPRTLAMGKLAVPDAFRYWSGIPSDAPDQFIAFAAFREAFGVTMIVTPDDGRNDPAVFRPGFLKGFKV